MVIFFNRYKFDASTFDGNVDIYHRFIEASKFAYAGRSSLGDIAFVNDALAIAKNITSPVCTIYVSWGNFYDLNVIEKIIIILFN